MKENNYQLYNAIKKKDDDLLNRESFIEEVVQYLKFYLDNSCDESNVVGIIGKWGDGKTSILNLSLSQIKKLYPLNISINLSLAGFKNFIIFVIIFFSLYLLIFAKINFGIIVCLSTLFVLIYFSKIIKFFYNIFRTLFLKTDFRIINFNPWFLEDKNKIIEQLLKTLANELFLSNISFSIIDYAKLFITKDMVCLFNIFSDQTSTQKLYEKIYDYFKKSNKKIIIIIDDIDRMQKDEVIETLKAIKTVANFPNVLYVLAYDKEKITDLDSNSDMRSYLEKIVPCEIFLPPIKEEELKNYLDKNLENIIGKSYLNFDKEKLNQLFSSNGILHYIKNLRQMKIFLNSFCLHYNAFKKANVNINIIDLLIITLFKNFNNNLHKNIYNTYRNELLQGYKNNWIYFINQQDSNEKFYLGISEKTLNDIDKFLIINTFYDESANKIYDSYRLISDISNFDLYFSYHIPNSNIQVILDSISDYIENPSVFNAIKRDLTFYADFSHIVNSNLYSQNRSKEFFLAIIKIILEVNDISQKVELKNISNYKNLYKDVAGLIKLNIRTANINVLRKFAMDFIYYGESGHIWDEYIVVTPEEEKLRKEITELLIERFIDEPSQNINYYTHLFFYYGLKCEKIIKEKLIILFSLKNNKLILNGISNLLYAGYSTESTDEGGVIYTIDTIIDFAKKLGILENLHSCLLNIKKDTYIMQNTDYIKFYSGQSYNTEKNHLVLVLINIIENIRKK